ncbi:hypothetical protein LX16_2749 [Stackebrandtia albiflava]|uniref:Uncharacterized protein n=2 Tax=Stackebrandtia albiflava TaxID=406432 RepID=A0A562V298_9ACTN|nr:hypothetical protein LX16_2749 [Stackebrandtia albiflava]
MDFPRLRDCDLQALGRVVDRWTTAVHRLHGARTDGGDVAVAVTRATWEGEAAEVAQRRVAAHDAQLDAAVTEATAVRDVLADTLSLLEKAKAGLTAVLDEVAAEPALTVTDTGEVRHLPPPGTPTTPHHELLAERAARLTELVAEAVTEATEADDNAAIALRWTVGIGVPGDGFRSAPVGLAAADLLRRHGADPAAIGDTPLTTAELAALRAIAVRDHVGDVATGTG